jgi:hypothetical protein
MGVHAALLPFAHAEYFSAGAPFSLAGNFSLSAMRRRQMSARRSPHGPAAMLLEWPSLFDIVNPLNRLAAGGDAFAQVSVFAGFFTAFAITAGEHPLLSGKMILPSV